MFNKPTGLLQQPFDPRDVWEDELSGVGEEVAIPNSYRVEGLQYEYQGAYPYCVSFACTTALAHLIKKESGGEVHKYSQPHLFFHSGGKTTGSYFRSNLNTLLEKGAISYALMPMPDMKYGPDPGWFEPLYEQAMSIPFTDPAKILGYMRINPTRDALKKAILNYGPLVVGVSTAGNYYSGNGTRSKAVDNHCVLLVGWDEDGKWVLFESLNWAKKGDGYVTVSKDYDFMSAFAITELPTNWKKQRDKAREKPFAHCLNHYGKPRDFAKEQEVANQMLQEFKKFNNQSVLEAAGKYWTVLVNAATYGGYSISYRKFGKWQPGDVISDIYYWRRTGKHIFDFNLLRIEQVNYPTDSGL